MDSLGLPTARYVVCNSYEEAKKAARENPWAQVVKVDGLALGKGVFVCDNEAEVLSALEQIFAAKTFGSAGETVLLEEKIVGEELSLLMLSDGKHLVQMAPCQDHKRRFDGDKGPKHGRHGCIFTSRTLRSAQVSNRIEDSRAPAESAFIGRSVV